MAGSSGTLFGVYALILATAVGAVGEGAGELVIPWCSGSAVLRGDAKGAASRAGQQHVVVGLSRDPSDEERATLRGQGIELLDYVAGGAWFACLIPVSTDGHSVSAETTPTQGRASAPISVLTMAPVAAEWKLHPRLLDGDCPSHAQLAKPPDAPEASKTTEWAAVYVQFFRDVDAETGGRETAARHGAVIRDCVRLANTLVAELPLEAVPALASEDAVQWIEPALPPLSALNDGNRTLVQANLLQEAPYDLTGAGVRVMVYDSAVAFAAHADFGGRLNVRDTADVSNHATHVAGTIGGSGVRSADHGGAPYQWRGMAPGVTLESYAHASEGTGVLLYSNPGDIEADYTDAILNHGADLANNSIGSNVASNGFDCDITGDYGITSHLIDALVRGAVDGPFRVVWAVGNERSTLRCGILYSTVAPPAAAKNHIAVGAVFSDDDSMTAFSSWGPTDDGRLKPDFCAPGDERAGDLGVTSTSQTSGYYVTQGTSMACPTVTGVCALLLQDFRARFPGEPDPTNAGLKVLLAHTAVDQGNPGPDYRFGYGSVRAKDAVDFMRSGQFLEDSVGDADTALYSIAVAGGEEALKATLAWDDYPGTPNVVPALVNDLDLLAISPSGVFHFPWTLDPDDPEAAATRNGADRLNNIEQVLVEAPEPGTWQLRVIGYSVPQGPQPFALAASPTLATCADLGIVAFDGRAYSCTTMAPITLTDCQLDTHPSVINTARVRVFSTSDALGDTVVLMETAPSSATFAGAAPLDSLDGPGIVAVSHGDVLAVQYEDEDGGDGLPAVSIDEVPIDCLPPEIGPPIVEHTATTATVGFQTNEEARIAVRFATSCGAWEGEKTVARYDADHLVRLVDLEPETEYFYAIEAVDPAGNTATPDNVGACFSFTTSARPDFFTELFDEENNDLANGTLVFTPDDSVSGYSAAFSSGTAAFPTNPAAGTPLLLGDDDSMELVLTDGKRVQFYGEEFDRFWVGSNGYFNFDGEDTIQVPALNHHFSARRVSGFFADLDPSTETGAGLVSFRQLDDHVAVTWQNVQEWDQPARINSFQVRLFFDGRIAVTWLAMGSLSGLAGLSQGTGVSVDFAESDLSAYGQEALVLQPIGGKTVVEGATLAFSVVAESPLGIPSLWVGSLPSTASFLDNGDGTGSFAWPTQVGDAGVYDNVRFVADDGVTTQEETIAITVSSPNLPPSATIANVLPAMPSTLSDLAAAYQYADPEGAPEGPPEIRWFRNGHALRAFDDSPTISHTYTLSGDEWHFTVRPSDGEQLGDVVTSPAVTISNTMDLDANGTVDAIDVQRTINAVLGIDEQGNEDVNGDGSINALDLQLVVNAALGLLE